LLAVLARKAHSFPLNLAHNEGTHLAVSLLETKNLRMKHLELSQWIGVGAQAEAHVTFPPKMTPLQYRTLKFCFAANLGVESGLDVGRAVAVEAGGGDGLGEDDTDGDEDGAGAGGERHGDFNAGAFGILIAAAKAESAFG
jgi:hypothetical protein